MECSHSVFGCTRLSRNNSYQQCKKNTWFNQECYEARKNFKKARNAFNKNKQNAILRQNYLLAKQTYNSIIRREKVKYGLKEKTILSDLCKKHPKQFWKKVKSQFKKPDNTPQNLDIDRLYDHFKSLYSNDTDQQDERNSHNDNFQGNAEQDNVILDEELDKEISYTELKDAVFSQNNS